MTDTNHQKSFIEEFTKLWKEFMDPENKHPEVGQAAYQIERDDLQKRVNEMADGLFKAGLQFEIAVVGKSGCLARSIKCSEPYKAWIAACLLRESAKP